MHSNRGATLIEVILAVVILTVSIVSLSMVFPKISKNVNNNQHRLIAGNLALTQMELLKNQPYAWLDPTDPSLFASSTPSCDCRTDDFSLMPSTRTLSTGTPYTMKSCIHYVIPNAGGLSPSQCPNAGDTGYKFIHVRVSWMVGAHAQSVQQQALKPRE